jgi:hypothetical protein
MKLLSLVIVLLVQTMIGQELKLMETIPLKADVFIGYDSYKNQYFIRSNVFYKKGPDGTFMYNDYQLGRIASVDIINPLKIVLFYEDVNTVVFVDNKLTEIERINFNNVPDFVNITTRQMQVITSFGSSMWIQISWNCTITEVNVVQPFHSPLQEN